MDKELLDILQGKDETTEPKKEFKEITLKFGKGCVGDEFQGKDGNSYRQIMIPPNEEVKQPWQTFVVKAASGFAVAIAGVGMNLIGFKGNSDQTGEIVQQTASAITGLRLLMTIIPIVVLFIAFFFFKAKFKLTDEQAEENSRLLKEKNAEK